MKTIIARTAAVSIAALVLLTGCNEDPVDYAAEGVIWKANVSSAFEHNESIANFRFEGDLSVQVDGMTGTEAAAPADAMQAFLPALTNGISWNGVYYRDPLRLEANVHGAEPSASSDIPLLIQDNKLYVSVPMLNEPDEYFEIDLSSEHAQDVLPAATMLQLGAAVDDLTASIIAGVDPQWVRAVPGEAEDEAAKQTGEAENTPQPAEPQTYRIEINEQSEPSVEAAVRNGWNAWTASFPAPFRPEPLPAEDAFDIAENGTIEVTVSPDGFLTGQRIELELLSGPPESREKVGKLVYSLEISEPNGSPEMTKSVPTNVLSFDNVLKFLAAGSADK